MPPAGLGEASVVLVWLVRLKMVLNPPKFVTVSSNAAWPSGYSERVWSRMPLVQIPGDP